MKQISKENQTFTFTPLVDIHDSESSTGIYMDVPGIEEGSLDISLEKDILTIKGKTHYEIPEGYKTVYTELREGEFTRQFTVNRAVDTSKAEASLKNGRLVIELPKLNPVSTKIAVRTEN